MSLFRPNRERSGVDPFLQVKMALFAIGAGAAVVGFAFEKGWLINAGIVVLVAGFLVRLLPRPSAPSDPAD